MRCTEKNYISRLKRGKEDALEFIVDNYLGLVKSAVYKVLSSLERDGIIDECINDVFLSIWNNSGKFTGEELDFKKWIYKIAKFKAIDYYRKEIKNLDVSLEDKEISTNKLVEEEIINTEDRNELIELINTLEPLDRDIFRLLDNGRTGVYDKYKENANEINVTRKSNGVAITIKDAIYDGKTLSYTYEMKGDRDLGDRAFIYEYEGGQVGSSHIEKVGENTYIGQYNISNIDQGKDEISCKINIRTIDVQGGNAVILIWRESGILIFI